MRRSITLTVALALALGGLALGDHALGAATPPPLKKVAITSFSACANGYFCFKPAAVTVKKGTKVVWTNNTTVSHTVTRCSPGACNGANGGTGKQTKLASPMIAPHKTYAFTFTKPGKYFYECTIHAMMPSMHAKVIVK